MTQIGDENHITGCSVRIRTELDQDRSSVYTPQLVVDGRDDQVGSDGKAIARALSENRAGVPVTVSIRDAQVQVSSVNALPLDRLGQCKPITPAQVIPVANMK